MAETREPNAQLIELKSGARVFPVVVRNGRALLPKGVTVPAAAKLVRPLRARSTPTDVRLAVKPTAEYGTSGMTKRLVDALGSNTVAALLGVSKDRPGRWISGEDSPSEVNSRQLADLDSLVGHLLTAFTPAQAGLWMEGRNPHLGARPIDVYRLKGPAPVLEAIQAHQQGAYA